MKQKESIYLLTDEQVLEAVWKGAVEMGIVPRDVAENPPWSVKLASNGAIIEFLDAVETSETDRKWVGAIVDVPETAAVERVATVEPHLIKQELVTVGMVRVPSVSTIRSWSDDQRDQALKFCRSVKWGKKTLADKPAFIVEPAPRGRRKVEQAKAPEAPEESTKAVESDFWDDDNETVESDGPS